MKALQKIKRRIGTPHASYIAQSLIFLPLAFTLLLNSNFDGDTKDVVDEISAQFQLIAVLIVVVNYISLPKGSLRSTQYISMAFLLSGLIAVAHLLALPTDPKNIWFLGYSLTRLSTILFLLGLSSIPFAVGRITTDRSKRIWCVEKMFNIPGK